jgi:hypothetical protein
MMIVKNRKKLLVWLAIGVGLWILSYYPLHYRRVPVYETHVVTSKTGAPYVKLNGKSCTHEDWQRQFLAAIDEGDELCVASGMPYTDRKKVVRWEWEERPEEPKEDSGPPSRAQQLQATCERLRDTATGDLSLNDWSKLRACGVAGY